MHLQACRIVHDAPPAGRTEAWLKVGHSPRGRRPFVPDNSAAIFQEKVKVLFRETLISMY
jgi:hypothetical protein